MGKSTSKIVETLVLPYQPVRYLVTNTKKIVLVTYDYKVAQKYEQSIQAKEQPERYYVTIPG